MTEDELIMAHGLDPSRLHRGGQYMRTTRQLLLDRDGPACGRCHRWIDMTLPGLHPQGATVGHVRSVAAGGSDRLSNLQLEHRICNLEGAPSVGDPEPTIARPMR